MFLKFTSSQDWKSGPQMDSNLIRPDALHIVLFSEKMLLNFMLLAAKRFSPQIFVAEVYNW